MATRSDSSDEAAIAYKIREVVGVFHNADEVEDVIEELELAGFDRAQINLMTSSKAAAEKLGHEVADVRELEDEPKVPQGTFVDRHELAEGRTALTAGLVYVGSFAAIGAVVATGGGVAAAIAAAVAAGGAGGALGAWLGNLFGQRRAKELEEQIKHGGLLLWVAVKGPEQETTAQEIMRRHSGRDVHVHEVTRTWGDKEIPFRTMQPDPFLFR